jgi:hypothetical protein
MFGHGCLPPDDPDLGCVPDFRFGAGFEGVVGVVVVGVVVVPVLLVPVLPVPVVLVPLGAAAAPAMPATAPPVASAPATIVAPSILDTFIGQTSCLVDREDCMREPSSTRPLSTPVGLPKATPRCV